MVSLAEHIAVADIPDPCLDCARAQLNCGSGIDFLFHEGNLILVSILQEIFLISSSLDV